MSPDRRGVEASNNDVSLRLRGTNQSGMRARNERLVLALVRQHKAMSKSEIARMTGLSAQTISVIMRKLEQEGLLIRGEPTRGKVGQPSVPMRLNPCGAYFFGLKVGRRSAELVLIDFLGRVKARAKQVYEYPQPDETLAFARLKLEELSSGLTNDQRERISGLGVAMPYFLWNWARILEVPASKMDQWRSADLRSSLAEMTDVPVFVENDATAACMAELVFGPENQPQHFLYFYVGYFIGGGVVLNEKIFSGRGNAGAIGPLPITDQHGKTKPLIDVASLYLLERPVAQNRFNAQMWEQTQHWDLDEAVLSSWIETAAHGLSQAIVSACSLIDFDCVKIDGWLPATLRDRLISEVELQLESADLTGLERPTILPGKVGPDARALGAASIALSRRYLA